MSSTQTSIPVASSLPPQYVPEGSSGSSDYNNIFLYATTIVVILLVLYLVWKYSSDDDEDSFAAGQTQENSGASSDYNLDEAIRKLKEKQQNIIKNLTSQFS